MDPETETATPTTDEAPSTTAATSPQADAPAETDWKAEAERLQAELAKEREAKQAEAERKRANDARAEEGRRRKAEREAQEREEERQRLRRLELRQEAIEQGVDPAEHVRTHLDSDFGKAKEDGLKAEGSRVWSIAKDLGVNPNEDDAFEDAHDFLQEAKEALTPAQFHRAMKQAVRAADAALEAIKTRRDAEAKAKEPPPPEKPKGPTAEEIAKTKAFEGHGAGTAASGQKTRFTRQELEAMTPEEYAKAREHLWSSR